jgi:hypothetical protein
MGAVSLPFDATFDELYGRGTVEQEPVAPGKLTMLIEHDA